MPFEAQAARGGSPKGRIRKGRGRIDYLNIHEGYGGRKELHKSDLSVDSFAVTADAVTHNEYTEPEDCFEILDLAGFELTQWSIVYDPINLRVLYRSKKSPEIKSIDLSKFNFLNMTLPLVREVDGREEFQDFSVEKNLELIKFCFLESRYFRNIKVSEQDMERMAAL